MTPLGKALGAQPSLVYRLRPKLFAPITTKFTTEALRSFLNTGSRAQYYSIASVVVPEYVASATTLYTSYGNDSVHPYSEVTVQGRGRGNLVQRNKIVSMSFQSTEDDRVNGVWIQGPITQGSQMGETWGFTGMPYIDPWDHNKHGLRMYDVSWPFFQSGADEGENEATAGFGSLKMKISALCDMFYVMLGGTDLVSTRNRATVRMEYNPTITHGEHGVFEMPPTPNTAYAQAGTQNTGVQNSTISWEQNDDIPNSTDAPNRLPGSLTGYVESVQHDISVNQSTGAVTATTTVQLSNAQQNNGTWCHVNWPIRQSELHDVPFIIDGNDFVFGEFIDGVFVSDSESRDVAPTDAAALNELIGTERIPPGGD